MSLHQLEQFINGRPRVRLGELPTPLIRLERLSRQLGVELWLKRDELSGVALGGNKTRKMEFILAEAISQGYQDVLTVGPVTSNHTMMTAMACRRLGLRCHCLVVGRPPDYYEGNILLLKYMGANLFYAPLDLVNPDPAEYAQAFTLFAQKQAEYNAYMIPPGGTMPAGELGYMNAILEIAHQCQGDLPFDAIFVAYGTGGTSTGLLLGQAVAGFHVPLYAVAVNSREAAAKLREQDLTSLFDLMAAELGLDLAQRPPIHELFGYAETGYAIPTAGGQAAIELLARAEGYLLDPVYTAKAFDGMLDLVQKGQLPPASRLLFLHTGGLSMTPIGQR
ncbi:MAG: pyridoxal-phosphate dependent enzyme [Chloroflexota bacterium]